MGHARARTFPGQLGTFAYAQAPSTAEFCSIAGMRFDGLIFTGPGNDPIQVHLTLCLDGTLKAYQPGPGFFAGTNSGITLFGSLLGQNLTDAVVPGGTGAFGAVSAPVLRSS